jgi:hypothetical protein
MADAAAALVTVGANAQLDTMGATMGAQRPIAGFVLANAVRMAMKILNIQSSPRQTFCRFPPDRRECAA